MKKLLIVAVALLLAAPAVSFAGSATSMWDLTIGGTVKFDTGWTTGGAAGTVWDGVPEFRPTVPQNVDTKYGNQVWGSGETALSFFVKGPDTWGAKTHAFVLGDFTGAWSASGGSGTFDLIAANMTFDWAKTSVTLGQASTVIGAYPTAFQQIGWNPQGWGGRAPAPITPEILLTQKLGKEFNAQFGIFDTNDVGTMNANSFANFKSLNSTAGTFADGTTGAIYGGPPMPNNAQDSYSRSNLPGIQGAINFSSDACGKIGPWNLQAGWAGTYGQQKFTIGDHASLGNNGTSPNQAVGTDPDVVPGPGPAAAAGSLRDKSVDMWYSQFKWMIPIIPEKNLNKTGALLFDGDVWAGQGVGNGFNESAAQLFAGNIPGAQFYARPDLTIVAPLFEGVFLHGQYWFTDKVSFNAWYSYTTGNFSSWIRSPASGRPLTENAATGNMANILQNLTCNILYDVNPAVRLGVEFNDTRQHFVNLAPGWANEAVVDYYRFAAYYFF